MDTDKIVGKKIGTVSIHVYKELNTNSRFFYIESENQAVLPASNIVEDTLKKY